MKELNEDLRWRVIYHQHLNGGSIRETARYRFTSTAFVSKIRNSVQGAWRGKPEEKIWKAENLSL